MSNNSLIITKLLNTVKLSLENIQVSLHLKKIYNVFPMSLLTLVYFSLTVILCFVTRNANVQINRI